VSTTAPTSGSSYSTASGSIVPVASVPTVPPPLPLFSTGQAVLLSVYLLGLCLLLFRLAIGTVRARRLARDAVLHASVRSSPLCAAPVTVGFFHPVVILPEHWRHWHQAQLEAVLTHEGEHARRRDSLVQWLALLNRAFFWFHPAAWWLERRLSALAEEACDTVVLARGHNPREYAECLIDIARSVTRSGARLNVAGMAMPGSLLPQRIRQIMRGRQAPHISQTRMWCVAAACAITCTVFAAGTLDHARQSVSPQAQGDASGAIPATKFVLGDLQIKGDVHSRDEVRDRILKEWKGREYGDLRDLTDGVLDAGLTNDFQDRGYFQVWAKDPVFRVLGLVDGKESILLIVTIAEGDQFRLGNFEIQNDPPDRPLSIPTATLREQFHLRPGDLFNPSEIPAGLERMNHLYDANGYKVSTEHVSFTSDGVHHLVNVTIRITE
jgi:beta-lactamase regulating signal transducer with metallopeptidase domain